MGTEPNQKRCSRRRCVGEITHRGSSGCSGSPTPTLNLIGRSYSTHPSLYVRSPKGRVCRVRVGMEFFNGHRCRMRARVRNLCRSSNYGRTNQCPDISPSNIEYIVPIDKVAVVMMANWYPILVNISHVGDTSRRD